MLKWGIGEIEGIGRNIFMVSITSGVVGTSRIRGGGLLPRNLYSDKVVFTNTTAFMRGQCFQIIRIEALT